jgi:hypothetical protein
MPKLVFFILLTAPHQALRDCALWTLPRPVQKRSALVSERERGEGRKFLVALKTFLSKRSTAV